ncbi:hypothetical protein PGTUg99_027624 [Puccinia graminis f. sp. tritici]|uniref:Vacuolar protein 14 C-terminal Fig4-binding domain-containing protein n=1 Tax=Puccinia graminis f. sp. tritici TaxID=56615 RepID=A0A5B0RMA4_PUCGR|nr:hypothetical protein PGTUg99_027624 [Puccinia graminis f. sp. tritici]
MLLPYALYKIKRERLVPTTHPIFHLHSPSLLELTLGFFICLRLFNAESSQIKDHLVKRDYGVIDEIVNQLSSLAFNNNPSWRWGGVMGLAACSIALGPEIASYLLAIVPPIISCFSDPDSKVRYFSCEGMYNVVKVAKGEILVYFNDLFDSLSKLAADPDAAVKNGAELLDRLIKDIVTEQAATYISVVSPRQLHALRQQNTQSSSSSATTMEDSSSYPSAVRAFSLKAFIPLLRERIHTHNPFTRQYLVSWLQLLNSIPEINLVSYLPDFLDGLITYLADSGNEIQLAVQNLLGDMMVEIDAVVHAKEYKEQERLQQRELRRQRRIFEKQMTGAARDTRQLPRPPQPRFHPKEETNDENPACEPRASSPLNAKPSASANNTTVMTGLGAEKKDDLINETGLDSLHLENDNPTDHDEDGDSSETSDDDTYMHGQGVDLNLASIVQILIKWMCIHEITEEIQALCLKWLSEIIQIDQSVIIPFTPRLIPIILGCLSHERNYIKDIAVGANYNLFHAIAQLPTPPPPSLPPVPPPPPPPVNVPDVDKRKHDPRLSSHVSASVDKFRNKIMRPERGNPPATPTPSTWTIRPRRGTRPNGIAEEVVQSNPDHEVEAETPPIEEMPPDPLDYALTVNALTLQFLNEYEETRLAALKWLMMLHNKVPNKILTLEDGTFPALLKTLSDDSEAVIRYDLELLSQISLRSLMNTEEEGYYFRHFMWNLLSLFGTDRNLLESRGNLIVRILCKNLNAERIYKSFAEYLEADEDLEFASSMVQNLTLIMITSPELSDMRRKLKQLETKESVQLFTHLYRSFSHNPISTLTLCLLCPMAYEHAFHLLTILAHDLEMTVGLLIQVDKLVQLLESPVFTSLRLQLLEPDKYPFLYKALYGILMLLPQSSAFATLRNRLGAVSTLGYAHAAPKATTSTLPGSNMNTIRGLKNALKPADHEAVNWSSLLLHFKALQTKHEKVRRQPPHHLHHGRDSESNGMHDRESEFNGGGLNEQQGPPYPNYNSTQVRSPQEIVPDRPTSAHPRISNQHALGGTVPIDTPATNDPVTSPVGHQRLSSTSTQATIPPASMNQPSKIPASVLHSRKKSVGSMAQASNPNRKTSVAAGVGTTNTNGGGAVGVQGVGPSSSSSASSTPTGIPVNIPSGSKTPGGSSSIASSSSSSITTGTQNEKPVGNPNPISAPEPNR